MSARSPADRRRSIANLLGRGALRSTREGSTPPVPASSPPPDSSPGGASPASNNPSGKPPR